MSLRRTIDMMRPLAQGKGTPHQRINKQPLMALIMAIDLALALICFGDNLFREASGSQANQSCGDLSPASLSQWLHSAPSPFLRSNSIGNRGIGTSHCTLAMPRIRGKPRRGAAWYAAASRRKRKEQFEAAWR
jgi:hypothetical protein